MTLHVSADDLRVFGAALFQAADAPAEVAERVARSLVLSNLRGHDSHGVAQIASYLGQIEKGALDPKARPTVLNERSTAVLIDGNWGFGAIAAEDTTTILVRKARAEGVAVAGIRRCNHIGRLGQYAEQAAAAEVIAMITLCGGGRGTSTAPYGGAARTLGTNPFAFGVPARECPPLIADFATTAVAGGKIALARDRGERIPEGWLLARDGRPTTDPADFYSGGMLQTMAGYKGLGLSMVAEALGGALTGATRFEEGEQTRNCVFMWAVAVDVFQPTDEYFTLEDRSIAKVRATPPAPGFERVDLPGDRGRATQAERERTGLPIPEATWRKLSAEAERLGVTPPSPMAGGGRG